MRSPAPRRAEVAFAPAIFDDARLDVAVFDHHGVVEHRHVGHAAVAMTRIEVGAEDRILLRRRDGDLHVADDVGVAIEDPPHAARRPELLRDDPHRDAAAATLAGGPVGDRLAAAKSALGEDIVKFAGALADQVRKNLTLLLAGEIGAGGGGGQVELRRIARVLGHGALRPVASLLVSCGRDRPGRRLDCPRKAARQRPKSAPAGSTGGQRRPADEV